MWLRCAAPSFGRWRYRDSAPPSCGAARPRYRRTRWFFNERRHDVPDPGGLMPLFRVLDLLSPRHARNSAFDSLLAFEPYAIDPERRYTWVQFD